MNNYLIQKPKNNVNRLKFLIRNSSPITFHSGLFHSHLARLRMNSESNSESRLKTTEKRL